MRRSILRTKTPSPSGNRPLIVSSASCLLGLCPTAARPWQGSQRGTRSQDRVQRSRRVFVRTLLLQRSSLPAALIHPMNNDPFLCLLFARVFLVRYDVPQNDDVVGIKRGVTVCDRRLAIANGADDTSPPQTPGSRPRCTTSSSCFGN